MRIRSGISAFLFPLIFSLPGFPEDGCVVRTIAGPPTLNTGEGGPALEARMDGVLGIAADGDGNIYLAEGRSSVVRRIDPTGTIRTIAPQAGFRYPAHVVARPDGSLYVGEPDRIVRIDADGAVSTVLEAGAGREIGQIYRFGVASDGTLFVIDLSTRSVMRVSPEGQVTKVAGAPLDNIAEEYPEGGQVATTVPLSNLQFVVPGDAGDVFITTSSYVYHLARNGSLTEVHRVTAVGRSGALVVDAAGTLFFAESSSIVQIKKGGDAERFSTFGGTDALAIAPDGALLALRSGQVYRIASDGTWTRIAGLVSDPAFQRGPASSAVFGSPRGVAVAPNGDVFVADSGNYRVWKISASGYIEPYAGTGESGFTRDSGPATETPLFTPNDIALDRYGNLYVSDYASVRKVTPSGEMSVVAGTGSLASWNLREHDGRDARTTPIGRVTHMAADSGGNVYLRNTQEKVLWIDAGDGKVRELRVKGKYGPFLTAVRALAIGPDDRLRMIWGWHLLKVEEDGTAVPVPTLAGQMDFLDSVLVVGPEDEIYIGRSGRVRRVMADGAFSVFGGDDPYLVRPFGDGPLQDVSFGSPGGMAVDGAGNLIYSDVQN